MFLLAVGPQLCPSCFFSRKVSSNKYEGSKKFSSSGTRFHKIEEEHILAGNHALHTMQLGSGRRRQLGPVKSQNDDMPKAMDAKEDDEPAHQEGSEKNAGSPSSLTLSPTTAGAALGVVAIVAGAFVLLPGGPSDWIKWVEDQIQSSGPLGPLYFYLAYVACTVLFLPGSLLTIAAGYLFGPLVGTAVVSVASTSGAAAAFLIARYAARPLVADYLSKYQRFSSMDRAIAEDGRKIVFLWRLSPLFPFSLSNYMFGLTGVGFWEYVGASWAGMLPATFAYVYLGGAGRVTVDALTSGGAAGGEGLDLVKLGLYGVGVVATLVIASTIAKTATKVLEESEDKPDPAK